MIPAAFEYRRAGPRRGGQAPRRAGEEAKLLAGGHSLLPAMKLRIARPTALVDIGRLDDLRYVREDGDRIAIGALTRHAALEADAMLGVIVRRARPRGRRGRRSAGPGTGGRSGARSRTQTPHPTSRPCSLTLDADLVARRPGGDRTIAAAEFFTGPFENALARDEVLVEIRVPKAGGGPCT